MIIANDVSLADSFTLKKTKVASVGIQVNMTDIDTDCSWEFASNTDLPVI